MKSFTFKIKNAQQIRNATKKTTVFSKW